MSLKKFATKHRDQFWLIRRISRPVSLKFRIVTYDDPKASGIDREAHTRYISLV